MTEPGPTVGPTTPTQVVAATLVGFGLSFLVLATLQGAGASLPLLGAPAWGSVLLIAVGIALLAARTRRERRQRPDTLEPRVALTRLVLGKTSVLAGAGLGGAYAALIVLVLPALPAPLAVDRLLHGGLALGFCIIWALVGWVLQRTLRVPPEDPDDSPDTPRGGDGSGPPPPVS